jgi:hypothetical protein
LNVAVSLGIISERPSDELFEHLTLRPFFLHAYEFMLEEAQLEDLLKNVYKV